MKNEEMSARQRARRRALRAAQVATIALAMTAGGCSSKGTAPEVDSGSVDGSADSSIVMSDSMTPDATLADAMADGAADATVDATADATADAAVDAMADAQPDAMADASVDAAACMDFPPTTLECCTDAGGFWDDASGNCAIAVPGPFVPPAAFA